MSYAGVIFDLDGTLLDSLPGIAEAANRILEEMEYPVHPMDCYRYFIGDGIHELFNRVLPPDWQERGAARGEKDKTRFFERLIAGYRTYYSELWPVGTTLYPGIQELLDALQGQPIKLAVLSNKSEDFTRVMVSRLLGEYRFVAVRGARPGGPTKPAPDTAMEILGLMGAKSQEIIFVGDSGVDMQTATNACMLPIGVLWGYREASELQKHGASQLVHHPTELLSFILN